MRKIILSIIVLIGVSMANSLPKYYTKILKNGLEVVAIPLKNGSGVITTDIFYKVGSRNEIKGKTGIAHMLEHMNFKSTKNLKAGEFDKIVKSFGGVNNASTGFDYTHYFIKSSSENLTKSLSLFAELMENLELKDEEFQPERKVVLEERQWRTDNSPMGYLYFRLFNNSFIYHPYQWTPIGYYNDIVNWDIEDIREFHKTYYQPKNAIIIVAGDIEYQKVFEESEKYFSHIKNSQKLPKFYMIEPKQDGEKRAIIYKKSDVEMVAIAYHIPNFQNRDQVALSALSEILSSGKSSRLQKVLIDEKRLVNSIYAYNMENRDPTLFLFLAVCNPNVKAEEVEKEFLNQIEKIKKEGITQEEIKKVKNIVKRDFIFELEDSSSVASLFGNYLARGDIKPLLSFEDEINKINSQKIVDVTKKYLIKRNSTTIILKKEK